MEEARGLLQERQPTSQYGRRGGGVVQVPQECERREPLVLVGDLTLPELAGRRSRFVDLPGHGISDRPSTFGYTLEEYAGAVAAALDESGVRGAELMAHSMGGAVAVVLAHRRPDLASRLVLAEANLDAFPPLTAASSGIAACEEDDFVERQHARVLAAVGPLWAATMRLADPRALHRSAVGLRRGSDPVLRIPLEKLAGERVHL